MIKKSLNVVRVDAPNETKDNTEIKMSFVASTSAEDRYGDIVAQNGWDLTAYNANPIVLFNHDASSMPIAKGEVDVIDGKLLIDVEFDMADPHAAEIGRKCQAGFLNSVSVGFNAIEATERSALPEGHQYKSDKGLFFNKAELLEVSVVTIPANPEANSIAAKKFDIDSRQVAKHILEILEEDGRYIIAFKKAEKPEPEEEDLPAGEEEQELSTEQPISKNKEDIETKDVEFADLPVTDEPFNPQDQDRAEIENNILGDGDWERYKKAHLYFDSDRDETKEGYKFIIGRMRDPDNAENAIPEDGRLYVFRDQLGNAVAAINGSREKPSISNEDRKAAYDVAAKYYDKLGLEIPPFKEDLSYNSEEEDEEEKEAKAFASILSLF